MVGAAGGQGEPAVPANHCRDRVPRRGRHRGVPQDLCVVVSVQIYETRGDDHPRYVKILRGTSRTEVIWKIVTHSDDDARPGWPDRHGGGQRPSRR